MILKLSQQSSVLIKPKRALIYPDLHKQKLMVNFYEQDDILATVTWKERLHVTVVIEDVIKTQKQKTKSLS